MNTPQLNPHIIITRQQLLAEPARRITLLVAPPGFGKTVYAAQLAGKLNHPVVWHSVDAWQRDIVELHRACLRAFQPVLPDIMKLAQMDLSSASEAALQVTHYIQQYSETPLVYVLDDVHWLAEQPPAEAWLKTLALNMPAHCYLILSGRSMPGLPLTELVARHEVQAINAQQLQFSEEETALLATFTGSKWSGQRLQQLTRQFNGWAAGITLALQESIADPIPDSVQPQAVFQTIAGEMLAVMPPELRHFLLAVATLDVITPERCSRILALSDSPKWLEMAMARNLFMMQYPHGYILHDLFREFLQTTLKNIDPKMYCHWHQAAANYFKQKQDFARAFQHHLRADDVDTARQIAAGVSQGYFAQGRWQVLRDFQRHLDAVDVRLAELDYVNSLIATDLYDYEEADRCLERAYTGFESDQNPIELWKVTLQRAFLTLQRGHVSETQTLLAELPAEELPDNLSGMASRLAGRAYLQQGQLTHARDWLERALPVFEAMHDKAALCELLQDLSNVYIALGESGLAEQALSRLVALRREIGNRMLLSHACNSLGYHYHLCQEYSRANEMLSEALEMTALPANPRGTGYLAWSMGDLQRDRGYMDNALHWYHYAIEASGERDPALRCGVLLSLMTFYRWQGDTALACQMGQDARQPASQYGLVVQEQMARLFELSLSDSPDALDAMREILNCLWEERLLVRLAQTVGVYIAAAHQQQDSAAVAAGV